MQDQPRGTLEKVTSERIDSRVWKITAVATIGSFMGQLDATIVNVSLSSLATDLHSSLSTIHWVTSAYLLALALMLPLNGWLVDRLGAKTVYFICFIAFTVTSLFCGIAWSANSLIAFRVLQGMSGGLLAPMSQMMIARAAGKNMAQVLSIAALPVLIAPLFGPVFAGTILQFASWRWLFLINLPIGGAALLLAYLFIPDDKAEIRPRSLDLVGLALLSPSLVLFLYGCDHLGERSGWSAIALASIMLALFSRLAARKGDAALIDLRLLRGRTFSTALTCMFLINGIAFASQMLTPYYLMRGCGFPPTTTGFLMAPFGIGMLCTYPLMGRITKNFGMRRVAVGGAIIALGGSIPFMYMAHAGMVIPLLIVSLFTRGVGMSAIGIPSITSGYSSVPRKDLPMATTALNIVQRLGGPSMTTLCAAFLSWRLSIASDAGTVGNAFTAAFGLLCGLQVVLLLIARKLPLWADQKHAS